MAATLNGQLNGYIRKVSDAVDCPYKKKKIFLDELRNGVGDFLELNPDASMEEIEKQFGSPLEIAESFISESDAFDGRIKKNIIKILLFAVIAALIIWAAFAVISLIDVHTEAHGYFTEGMLFVRSFSEGVR